MSVHGTIGNCTINDIDRRSIVHYSEKHCSIVVHMYHPTYDVELYTVHKGIDVHVFWTERIGTFQEVTTVQRYVNSCVIGYLPGYFCDTHRVRKSIKNYFTELGFTVGVL